MPQASDSSYTAVSRHRRPFSTEGRPPALEIVDDNWATERLGDDDVEVSHHEAAVAPLLEEGELDADAIVVSPTGSSSATANNASERRRREEGWTELGLDQFMRSMNNSSTTARPAATSNTATPSGG